MTTAAAAPVPSARPPRPPRPLTTAAARRAPSAAALAAPAGIVALVALLALTTAPPAAAAIPHQEGDKVQLNGLVTDTGGTPIAGVAVVLEMGRKHMSWRDMHRVVDEVKRVSTVTNARGEYTLEWPWDSYFNHYEVVTGIRVRHGRNEVIEVLDRRDLTDRIEDATPVAEPITIAQRALVDRLQGFIASVRSTDERATYEELGMPDDVKRVNYTGHPEEEEVSWWYFAAGKVYRFRDGRLEHVDHFEPVPHF